MNVWTLEHWINQYLTADRFKDYAPNGLQVEGKTEIRHIVTGVSASQALIDTAISRQADAILVHHGYFWKNEPQALIGMKGRRIRALIQHDINLLAYHLPLDAHTEIGNNVLLGQRLGIQNIQRLHPDDPSCLIFHGELTYPVTTSVYAQQIASVLHRTPMVSHYPDQPITRIAWCTGGAQDYLDDVCGLDFDAFISGEVSERTIHTARENGIVYFSAGHHATERYGIQALGQKITEQFLEITCEFVDIDNPA